ncbi:MAG: 4-hydroxy-tetrahydrodipicolinate synthase [Planctomycetota bacterium]|jgi:4-hydroxy-tetrahydrodipicolinate synthase
MFSGSIVAITTPFTDDASAVDFDKLDELIEWHIESGTSGIVPCGCTGEAATLTHDEQEEVISRTIKTVNGRIKVIAGTGSNNTAEAVSLSKKAGEAGADGVLVITPYYNKPTPEGQFRHYKMVADAAKVPVMLYNVPGRTGTKMTPETIARLFNEVENVTCVKEACGSVDQVSSIIDICDIAVLSGDDSLTLPMMSVGGTGVVSVAANLLPREVAEMVKFWEEGKPEEAKKMHYKLLPIFKGLFIETNPIVVKAAMQMAGLINGVVRMPLCEITSAGAETLRKILTDYGLSLK